MIVGPDSPPPLPGYGDRWERGLDPWHRDAFPAEFADAAPRQEYPRKEGWHLIDWCGNSVGFIPDGTEVPDTKQPSPETGKVGK